MSEAKFTKGEWFVVESIGGECLTVSSTNSAGDIASIWSGKMEDAKLIKEAPAMYKMLITASEILKQANGCAEAHTAEEIDTLLAKVRGEQNA